MRTLIFPVPPTYKTHPHHFLDSTIGKDLDDIILGSHNPHDEGYFDGAAIFDWWRRAAVQKGVTYRHDTVVGIDHDRRRVKALRLASGDIVAAGAVINAAGPRGAEVAVR